MHGLIRQKGRLGTGHSAGPDDEVAVFSVPYYQHVGQVILLDGRKGLLDVKTGGRG